MAAGTKKPRVAKKRTASRRSGGARSSVAWKDAPNALAISGRKTLSGERVNPVSAMRLSAYFGGIRNIAEDLAKLPKSVVESLVPRGRLQLGEHAVTRVFHEDFNEFCDAFTGVQTITQWALGYGNGLAEIEIDGHGEIAALWPIHPTRVRLRFVDGNPVYSVSVDDVTGLSLREPVDYLPDEVLHLRGVGDQWQGWSIAQIAAESIGLGLAARGFAAAFFGNDTAIGNVVTLKGRIPKPERESYRNELQQAYASTARSHGLLVLDNEATLSRMGMPPQDAQFIETQEFTTEDIARFLRMPPHKLGHLKRASGWSTLEASNTDYVVDCLMPWAARWEKQARRKLLALERRRALVFFFQGQMRGDFKSRTEGLRAMVAGGIITPNEARETEDKNPSTEPGADMLWMQGAMAPMSRLISGPPAAPRPALPRGDPQPDEPADPPPTDAPEAPPEDDGAKAALLHSASERVSTKVVKAHDRHAAKHEKDLPAFSRWARGFFEGIREDLIHGFGQVLGERVGPWAAARSDALGRQSLDAFASAKPLSAESIETTLYESASEVMP
jgi:HK97 family phage portal protein